MSSKTYDFSKPETNNDPAFTKVIEEYEEKILEDKKEEEKEINELTSAYQAANATGFYRYITEIDNKSMLFFSSIFLLVFKLANKLYFDISSLASIGVAILVIYFLNERRRTTDFTDMKELEIKLVRITPNPKYFHLDAGIVELIYSIREFRAYNDQAFVEMLSSIDLFLALTYQVENDIIDCHFAVEQAQTFKRHALNHLMSIIHRTPQDHHAVVKIRKAADSLHFILNHHIELISKKCNKQIKKDGLNSRNRLVLINEPRAFDTNFENRFDIF